MTRFALQATLFWGRVGMDKNRKSRTGVNLPLDGQKGEVGINSYIVRRLVINIWENFFVSFFRVEIKFDYFLIHFRLGIKKLL